MPRSRAAYAPEFRQKMVELVHAGRSPEEPAWDKAGNTVGKGDMRAQFRQVCENLKEALAASGAGLEDIVKTNTYVTNMDEFFKCVDIRHEYSGPGWPTSTTV